MAYTLSRYLRLRIEDSLTSNSRYNLEKLDLLGAQLTSDSTDNLNIRSRASITIEPNSAVAGGSGVGGVLNIGPAGHSLAELNIRASSVNLDGVLGLLDQAATGSRYLRVRYVSDISGAVDTTADRVLSIDMQGADRSLVIGADFLILGPGNITLSSTAGSSVVLPASGTLATLNGAETLTNKTIDATLNTLIGILPDQTGNSGKVLSTDGSTLSWETVAGTSSVQATETNWLSTNGTVFVFNHSLNSTDVMVSVRDTDTTELILIDSIDVINPTTVQLTASEAPANSWRVLLHS